MTFKEIDQTRKLLIEWYRRHQRRLPWRETDDPYRIWVSEVMLQQTQVQTVIPYYQKFLQHFPDVKKLANSNLQRILKAWEGLGYYARARNMHRSAKIILDLKSTCVNEKTFATDRIVYWRAWNRWLHYRRS